MDRRITLRSYVRRYFSDLFGTGLVTAIDRKMKDGKVLFLIDGGDEIPEWSVRKRVGEEVSSFVSGINNGSRCIVTSRSVGYASEAEMDAWIDMRNASAEWDRYLEASRKAAEFLGGSLGRSLKTWGPASMSDFSTP